MIARPFDVALPSMRVRGIGPVRGPSRSPALGESARDDE